MKTPILITTWKRKEKIKNLLISIKRNKPQKLYIACDGPRDNFHNENLSVYQVRETIEKCIDWDCDVQKLYSKKNLGCRNAMTKAINWFFENESEGIILEEDCIPNEDFIYFCTILLNKFREDKKIWTISGSNHQEGNIRGNGSYYLSKYFHCWGWATWRDRWLHFDSEMKSWPIAKKLNTIETIFNDKNESKYWQKTFNDLYRFNKPDSWAYRWLYTCLINNGYSIIPNKNLIKNIGYGESSTHTNYIFNSLDNNISILPLTDPTFLVLNSTADKFTFYNHYKMNFKKRLKVIYKMPLYYPKKIIYKFFFYILRLLS